MQVTTIGLDPAKHVFRVHVFRVHGVDAAGNIVPKRRLRRSRMISLFAGLAPCTVGMEARATAHFRARELKALGHDVRLMPAQYTSRLTSSAARTMPPTPPRYARRYPGPPCGLCR